MGLTKIILSAAMTLSGLLPSSCHKAPATAKAPATDQMQTVQQSAALATNSVVAVMHVIGNLSLTNRCETRVRLGTGKECLVTPKMLDGRNVLITLAMKTRTNTGKIHDLTVAQVITQDGEPLEVVVGDYNLTMTPLVASE